MRVQLATATLQEMTVTQPVCKRHENLCHSVLIKLSWSMAFNLSCSFTVSLTHCMRHPAVHARMCPSADVEVPLPHVAEVDHR